MSDPTVPDQGSHDLRAFEGDPENQSAAPMPGDGERREPRKASADKRTLPMPSYVTETIVHLVSKLADAQTAHIAEIGSALRNVANIHETHLADVGRRVGDAFALSDAQQAHIAELGNRLSDAFGQIAEANARAVLLDERVIQLAGQTAAAQAESVVWRRAASDLAARLDALEAAFETVSRARPRSFADLLRGPRA